MSEKSQSSIDDGIISWRDLSLIVVQLCLLLLVFRQYQIEHAGGFLLVAQIAFAGFLVHAFLPLRYRLPFFALLSIAATTALLGAVNVAWMVLIGSVLIGICHVPVPFALRGAMLIAVALLLAAQRSGNVGSPWSEAIWPILGSMFMFRLIVYFHDLRHDKHPRSLARTAAYFFMLPNTSFPLFPVVDYGSFRRNYYDDRAYRIYQIGINWMVRGVIHLILYRAIYYYVTLSPAEVTTPALLMQYLVANFLLYLKVSGIFHLAVGILYLFGFRLPETHNRYFLSAGFTDFWRRINIYWKDFMQKVFYYPAVFRLKRFGANTAIVVATLWVFLLTWFLHAYQWFWIRGTTLFVLQDILFWAILGLLVVVNSLYEMKHGRVRTLGKPKFSWRTVGFLTLKSYVTFWFICILWSFWTAEKLADWASLWQALLGEYTMAAALWPVGVLLLIFLGNIPRTKAETETDTNAAQRAWGRDRAATFAIVVLLIGISIEPVFSRFGTQVSTVVHSLRQATLSRLDVAKLERGYYEGLTDVTRFNSQLWETYAKRPTNWLENQGAGLKRFVGGFAQTELIPSFVSNTAYGTITINRWGMRDRDYAQKRDPKTFRAALLGPSSLMGWGVADDATFEALLEQRLNRELTDAPFARYELLNYGVPGYQPPQQLVNFERALSMQPNAIIYIAAGREASRSVSYLAEVLHKSIDIPYPRLREIVSATGVTIGMREADAERKLMPHAAEILAVVYEHIADQARRLQIQPIWVFLPQVREGKWQEETSTAVSAAENAGFIVIRLDDIYRGQDLSRIRLAEWDDHPNAYGHKLIADRLFEQIHEARATIFSSGVFLDHSIGAQSHVSREKL